MRKKWDKETVIEEFLKFAKTESDFTPKNIKAKRNDLYIQIGRKFGNYRQFLISQGYDYIPSHKTWSPEIIKAELIKRHKGGLLISSRVLTEENNALQKAAIRYYGSLKNAVEACGINYDEVREFTFWNRDIIKQEFLKLYHDKRISRIEHIREQNRGLDHAIRKHYQNYGDFCAELGIDISTIHAGNVRMSKEQFLEKLISLSDNDTLLNPSSVYQHIPKARELSNEYFGSYTKALAYIGVDINDHLSDRLLASLAGREFESLVNEMFKSLSKNYEYQYKGFDGIIPDFYDSKNNTILDAKLSSWSVFNCKTIEKYMPYCEKIVIIYLRGDEIKHPNNNVEMRAISDYYELLREQGLSYLIDEFEGIKETLKDVNLTYKEAV